MAELSVIGGGNTTQTTTTPFFERLAKVGAAMSQVGKGLAAIEEAKLEKQKFDVQKQLLQQKQEQEDLARQQEANTVQALIPLLAKQNGVGLRPPVTDANGNTIESVDQSKNLASSLENMGISTGTGDLGLAGVKNIFSVIAQGQKSQAGAKQTEFENQVASTKLGQEQQKIDISRVKANKDKGISPAGLEAVRESFDENGKFIGLPFGFDTSNLNSADRKALVGILKARAGKGNTSINISQEGSLAKAVRTKLQTSVLSADTALAGLRQLKPLIDDSTVGFLGSINSLKTNVSDQLSAFAAKFRRPDDKENLIDRLVKGWRNNKVGDRKALSSLMSYVLAKAVDPSGKITDQDVRKAAKFYAIDSIVNSARTIRSAIDVLANNILANQKRDLNILKNPGNFIADLEGRVEKNSAFFGGANDTTTQETRKKNSDLLNNMGL